MSRKPLITTREKLEIAKAYNQNPDAKAEKIRQISSRLCGRELGLSTVQRELAKLRREHPKGSTDPVDNQWSLASLKEYPIEPSTIQFLLYIQNTFEANIPTEVKELSREEGYPLPFLTIRLAIWISRLIHLAQVKPLKLNLNTNKWDNWIDNLVSIAMWYSNYEIGCELAHIEPINTINFDAPTLDRIAYNIHLYNTPILQRKGIKTGKEPNAIEILKSMDIGDILPKGGRHARTHSQKK